jgi:intracellular sulfur oxidation DsrE/DsrF family protein
MTLGKLAAAAFVASLALSGLAHAQSTSTPTHPLLMPSYGAWPDVPGAANRPDPALDYKVVFPLTAGGPASKPNAGLEMVARYANTLAQHGVPADHRHIAVVMWGPITPVILTDAAYAQRTGVKANPNTQLLKDLKAMGVDVHVCGQAAQGQNITRDMQSPDVTRDLSGTISMINYQVRGYIPGAD